MKERKKQELLEKQLQEFDELQQLEASAKTEDEQNLIMRSNQSNGGSRSDEHSSKY